jgi:hypothetical protein
MGLTQPRVESNGAVEDARTSLGKHADTVSGTAGPAVRSGSALCRIVLMLLAQPGHFNRPCNDDRHDKGDKGSDTRENQAAEHPRDHGDRQVDRGLDGAR